VFVDVTPPLFVFADVLMTFDSTAALLGYIEPIDADEVTAVVDSVGRRFALRSADVTRGKWIVGGGDLWLESESAAEDVSALDDALRKHIGEVGPNCYGLTSDWLSIAGHDELVAAVRRATNCE
jgi:hypothetical protein